MRDRGGNGYGVRTGVLPRCGYGEDRRGDPQHGKRTDRDDMRRRQSWLYDEGDCCGGRRFSCREYGDGGREYSEYPWDQRRDAGGDHAVHGDDRVPGNGADGEDDRGDHGTEADIRGRVTEAGIRDRVTERAEVTDMGEMKGSKGTGGRGTLSGDRKAGARSASQGSRRADGRSTASDGRRPDGKSIAPGRRADGKSVSTRGADGKSIRTRGAGEEVYAAGSHHRGRRKNKKKGNVISIIILVIAIAVFCVSAYKLFTIGKGYYDGRSEYDKIKNLAIGDGDKKDEDGPKVNFDELKALNPDTVAWIRFDPEPKIIDYPVVQGKDNQEYLHKTFSANENSLGTIFLNVDNNPNFTDENSIIYGHRMKDGSMFRHLVDYEDKAFWEANPYFYIYTPDGQELKYHIYSMGQVVDTSDTYLTEFNSQEEYQNFLNMTKEVSLYDTGVEVTTGDTIVTLSTCTSASDEHRFVVRGVRVWEDSAQ